MLCIPIDYRVAQKCENMKRNHKDMPVYALNWAFFTFIYVMHQSIESPGGGGGAGTCGDTAQEKINK